MKLRDFCLVNLKSHLIDSLEIDNIKDVKILLDISDELLCDFNRRIITPENINDIYLITEYFMIEDNIEFLIYNSIPSDKPYQLRGVELPLFMTEDKNSYNYKILEELIEYNLYDWILFLFNKDCYYNFNISELSIKKNKDLMNLALKVGNKDVIFLLSSFKYEATDEICINSNNFYY